MRKFTKMIAVLMLIATLTAVFAACNSEKDDRIIGTWKQTDEIDGNWTWTFTEDGKCSLTDDATGSVNSGTYKIVEHRIHVNLEDWTEEQVFSYAVTDYVLDLENFDYSFYLMKQ